MNAMDAEIWVAVIGAFVTLFAGGVAATWALSSRHAAAESRTQEKITNIDTSLREKMEGNYNLAITKLEAVGEREAKGRHDLANELQRHVGMLVMDDKALSQRVNDLAADVVRKSDLAASESRMMAFLQKLDTKFDELLRSDRQHP